MQQRKNAWQQKRRYQQQGKEPDAGEQAASTE